VNNSGVIHPPTDSEDVDAAKAEKLDRAAKTHTLCYHSHFFKGEVLEELWLQATYGNCQARRRGRESVAVRRWSPNHAQQNRPSLCREKEATASSIVDGPMASTL